MENSLIDIIINLSPESLICGFIVFLITMLIKIPIKKVTSKKEENTRKALNSIIILIPISVSLLVTMLYYRIKFSVWFSLHILECSISVSLISMSIYAVYERIIVIIKSVISNQKIDLVETKETLDFVKNNLNKINDKSNDGQLISNNLVKTSITEMASLLKYLKENIDYIKNLDINLSDNVDSNLVKIQNLNNKENDKESYNKKLYVTKGE